MVINDVCQVIGRQAVRGFKEHFVVKDVRADNYLAANQVVHYDVLIRFNEEPYYEWLAAERTLFPIRASQRIVHHTARRGIVLEVGYLFAFCLKLLGRIEGYVCQMIIEQILNILPIDIPALALTVGAVLADLFNLYLAGLGVTLCAQTFVNLYAQPVQGFQDILLRSGHETCGVGIFYT